MFVDGLIGTHEPDDAGTFTLQVRRGFRVGVEDLWTAISDPARLRRWFAPVVGELRPGGTFQLTFREGGTARGAVEHCEQPSRLRLTWAMADEPPGQVDVSVRPSTSGGATFALDHCRVPGSGLLRNLAGWQTYLEQMDLMLGGHDFPDWWDRHRHLRRRYSQSLGADTIGTEPAR